MRLKIILLLLAYAKSIQFLIIGSNSTQTDLLSYFILSYVPLVEITQIPTSFEVLDEIKNLQNFSLIIDLTNSELQHEYLSLLSIENEVLLLILGSGTGIDWVFYSEPSIQCQHSAIKAFFNHFNHSNPSILHTQNDISIQLKEIFHYENHFGIHLNTGISSNIEEISHMLGMCIKIKGIQALGVLGDKELCLAHSNAIKMSYLEKEGNIILYTNECIYQVNTTGSFILVPKSMEDSENNADYFQKSFRRYFDIVKNMLFNKYNVKRVWEESMRKCVYVLVNIVDGNKKIVGEYDNGDFMVFNEMRFFGGKNVSSWYKKPIITISANTGFTNPLGYPSVYQNSKFQQGTYFAVEKINKDRIFFNNYELVLYDKVDCGVSIFDYNYSKECYIKHLPYMGYAHIPSLYAVTPGVMNLLKDLGSNLPFVGGAGSSIILSNKKLFPTFTRVVTPINYFAEAWTKLIGIFGWKNIVLFYTNETFGNAMYDVFIKNEKILGYKILNDEKYRAVEQIMNNSTIDKYYEHMRNALSLGCNLFFLPMADPAPFFWIEGLYDLGVRRGNLTFIFFTLTGTDAISSPGGNPIKRKELLHGSFLIYNAAWVNEYGESMRAEYLKYSNITWSRSFFIDAVYSSAYTINFLMSQGRFYENHTEFINAQRSIRMVGCTGVISFDHSSNDRNLYYFNVYNFYEDSNGIYRDAAIGLIAPLSTVYYTVLKDPIWPGGVQPLDMMKNYENCPFRENQIIESSIGKGIKIGISLGLLVLVFVITLLIFRKISYRNLVMLNHKCYATFEDYLTIGFIFVETLQIIAIGPEFQAFNQFLSNLSEILSLNLVRATTFKDTIFWIIFYTTMSFSYFWLIILLLSLFNIPRFFRSFTNKIISLKEMSIPIMSNYLFIPVLVCILSIPSCTKAIGSELKDTYLDYDCNIKCWDNFHIALVITACFLIIVYVPLAILYRTLWQEENTNITIRAHSKYLVFKNLFYVSLIILSKIIKTSYQLTYSLVYIIGIIGMFVFIIKIKNPYNFDRANLWTKILMVCVFWNTLLSILCYSLHIWSYVWFILQMIGISSILIWGLIIQSKLPPSMVISKKGKNIVELFRFAFGIEKSQKAVYSYYSVEQDENIPG
ncbi:hypothetical protein SteCoe_29228 [Stentor coeruleus]|uniref:Receptor ligand binding region domain-containing protein n=1 Tax=Stentor coeruleus TaxID=5963 RepID=A0A1R2B6G7_9CILI|nr:hypothetical protein SteCoe_29228 [Stentor coeruleus]